MKKDSLLNIYDDKYAEAYDQKFLTDGFSKVSSDYELDILKRLINKDSMWLDAGCGTGYFLSKFPGYNRAGLDISPGMLKEAKKRNPDALLFKEADFRIDIPEWREKWSVITSMWNPYSYLDSMGEFETMISNFIRWTQPGGNIFIPIADLEDLSPSLPLVPYERNLESIYAGTIYLTSYTWTWIEKDGDNRHINMIAPHIEHVVHLMAPFFETIEIVRYPPPFDGWVSRKAVLAKNKLSSSVENSNEAKIIRHEIPPSLYGPYGSHSSTEASQENTQDDDPLAAVSHRQLISELSKRLKNGQLAKSLIRKLL
ncbi:hypothetical protein GCM10011386_46250 [Parapedobacter defluvii]|uniref:Methyltransferase domain-containing protein n=1 Tax=Parapedobacter defluvii TaxID=2045106 RepID=A0ABQ1N0X7_9SPHI|nr:class I SAM-dependent methyltransferase [Parapedobacter defluvii]GGC48759.1 hypothetical protein GCM10011386_46250 [Parapedobacter defluvii]